MPALEPPTPEEEPATGLRYRVTSATSATFLIFVIDRLVQVAFLAVLARVLLPAEVAVSTAANLFVTFAVLISHMGVGAALVQRRDLSERAVLTARTLVLCSAAALFVAAEAAAPLIAAWFRNPHVTGAVRALAPLCLIQAMTFAPQAVLTRKLRARDLSLVDLFSGVIGQGMVAIPLAMLGWSYWALIIGVLAQSLSRMVMVQVLEPLPLALVYDRADSARLWVRGFGFSLTRALQRAAAESDRLIIGRELGPAALGLYARANGLMAFPGALYGAVADRVAFPAFAKVQAEPARLSDAYTDAMALTALVGAPVTILLVILGPEVIRFILGQHWLGAIAPFKALSVAVFFRMADRINGTLLRGAGRPYLMAAAQIMVAIAMVVGSIAAAPYGIRAVAFVAVTTSALSFVLLTGLALRVAGVRVETLLRALSGPAASAALAAVVVLPIAWWARESAWSSFATLLACGASIGLVGLAAIRWAPGVFLGRVGSQALSMLLTLLRAAFARRRSVAA